MKVKYIVTIFLILACIGTPVLDAETFSNDGEDLYYGKPINMGELPDLNYSLTPPEIPVHENTKNLNFNRSSRLPSLSSHDHIFHFPNLTRQQEDSSFAESRFNNTLNLTVPGPLFSAVNSTSTMALSINTNRSVQKIGCPPVKSWYHETSY